MATPKEKFAEALVTLKELQDKGTAGFYTDENMKGKPVAHLPEK